MPISTGSRPTDRIALVAAASRGIGRAAAAALARDGCRVAICGRDGAALDAAAREIAAETQADILPIPADVSRQADAERFVDAAAAHFGGVDILVTNSGGPRSALFGALTDDDWKAAVDLLLMSVVRLTRRALPHLRARGGGRIVCVTSIAVKQPVPGLMLSNAIRAGVTGFVKTLAAELAPERITVNCVAPGFTRTDRVVELAEATAKREGIRAADVDRRTLAAVPMGRMGEPGEPGEAIAFLASERASYITGQTLVVDGGYVKSLL
jgi:3-oxoacyl-[acyl-carrier protein] reductase